MSSVVMHAPSGRRPRSLYLLTALVSVVALAFTIGNVSKVTVTVAGQRVTLPGDATVADVAKIGLLEPEPGDLYSIEGKLIEGGGGAEAVYLCNGRRVDRTNALYDGDSLSVLRGQDVTEGVVEQRVELTPGTLVRGKGPITRTLRSGHNGLAIRRVGQVSGEVQSEIVVRKPRSIIVQKFSPPKNRKLVALTFDDGPWGEQTNKILRILRREKASATFFVVGIRATQYPEIVKREEREGHQVGSHTLGHALLTTLPKSGVHKQVAGGSARIRAVTGEKPTWFRPPGGGMNAQAWAEIRRQKLRVVMWTVDPQDWRQPNTGKLVSRTVGAVKPGSIVLMHDGGGDRHKTVKALPRIIRELKKKGYEFVTVQELVAAER